MMALQNGFERLAKDGTVDTTFPVQQLAVQEMSYLADGRMMVASTSAVGDGSTATHWTPARLFPTPRTVATTEDAGADAAAPTSHDGGAKDAGVSTTPVDAGAPADSGAAKPHADGGSRAPGRTEQFPAPEGPQEEQLLDRGSRRTSNSSPPATGKMTQAPTVGCSTTPGRAAGAPWLLLALAALVLSQR